MGKFVKKGFYIIVFLAFAGCASVQMPDYIGRADHPYERKIRAGIDKVSGAVVYVLKQKGWTIAEEAVPTIYERDDRYDSDGYPSLLIMTDIRKNSHLNIFIHSLGNTCDVEVRYEARTSFIKTFVSTRNDRLVQGILDAVEQEVNR